jgi:hypothetical protein
VSNATFKDLVAALDLVAIERLPNGYMTVHGNVPAWFQTLAPGTTASGPFTLDRAAPFIQTFVEEAGRFWWADQQGRLKSGPCAATDAAGAEFHYEATALSMGLRRFLLVERLADFDHTQHVLQIARDQALAEEKSAVRRQVVAKHADKLLSLINSLDAAQLSPPQAGVVQRIKREGEELRKALGTT